MLRQLGANVRLNLIFYRRNRLLLLVVILLAFTFTVSLIPTLLFETSTQRFRMAQTIFEHLGFYLLLLAAALGLLGVSSHLRDRSIKMVATKPVPPELWLLSHFLSAAVVFVILVGVNLLVATSLLVIWGVPFQGGFVYLSLVTACRCMLVFSFLTYLSVLVHPALAGLIALVLQEGTFYQLSLLAASGVQLVGAGVYRAFLLTVEKTLFFVYSALPVFSPYGNSIQAIQGSYRVEPEHLTTLLLIGAYTLVAAALLYFLTTLNLRRRRFI